MLGRYELTDEKSNKFWSIDKQDDMYVVRWGRIGATGQEQRYDQDSFSVTKKVNEKLAKGYRLVASIDAPVGEPIGEKAKEAALVVMGAMSALGVKESSVRDRVRIAFAKAKAATVAVAPVSVKTEVGALTPSRCTADLPEDLTKEYLIAETKMDGSRYVMYIGCSPHQDGKNALLSRRPSATDGRFVEKTDNCPHIFEMPSNDLVGTILDGEIQAENFLETNSIMNSSPKLALSKQTASGFVKYYVFDIMFYCGTDVRQRPLTERRKILEYVVACMENSCVVPIEQFKSQDVDFTELFNRLTSEGGEGLIIKDVRRAYGLGWSKMKKSYDISCVVSGFKAGSGKYKSGVGSIALSVYDEDGVLTEIGFASGFDDKIRADMGKNPEKYLNKVVDVFAQEIQDSKKSKSKVGRLRHPTFHRFRDDMNKEDCTAEKMWNDFKKVKSERAKKFSR